MILRSTLLFVLFSCCITASRAQSIQIYEYNKPQKVANNDTLTFYLEHPNHKQVGSVWHFKITGNQRGIRAKKWDVSPTDRAYHSMCFAGKCWGAIDTIIPLTDTVTANSFSHFSGVYEFEFLDSIPPNNLVAYILFDELDPTDSAIVYAQYRPYVVPASVNSVGNGAGIAVYPNPASDVISFAPPANGVLLISNVVGQLVEQPELHAGSTLDIPVAGWPNGSYYYTFQNDDGGRTTGKFVVAH